MQYPSRKVNLHYNFAYTISRGNIALTSPANWQFVEHIVQVKTLVTGGFPCKVSVIRKVLLGRSVGRTKTTYVGWMSTKTWYIAAFPSVITWKGVLLSPPANRDKFNQHDDVIKWKHFPRYWPFVRRITGLRWIPRTNASDAELWCFLWSAPEYTLK